MGAVMMEAEQTPDDAALAAKVRNIVKNLRLQENDYHAAEQAKNSK